MIDIVISTRPDVIKFSPLILELDFQGIPFNIVHEEQHTDWSMFGSFLEELGIKKFYHRSYKDNRHPLTAVYGDTDGAFRRAYDSKRRRRDLLHVEAGLRCGDRFMWEEMNRKLIDSISDYYFAPTVNAKNNLLKEGVPEDKIYFTGNLIVDTLKRISPSGEKKSVILVTIHRRENLGLKRLEKLMALLKKLSRDHNIIFPVHPHTRKVFKKELPHFCTPPMSYWDFIRTMMRSKLVITDSGGAVEESLLLRVPCIIIREYTERPEALLRNSLMCKDLHILPTYIEKALSTELSDYSNPYYPALHVKDKTVSQIMVDIIKEIA